MLCPKPWPFGKIFEDSAPYLRVPFNFLRSTFYGGGSEDVGNIGDYLRARWIDCSVGSLLGGLCYCWRVALLLQPCIFAVVLWDSILLFPWVKGDPKFLEGLLHPCNRCPGKSSPCLIASSLCDKEGLDGIYSLLSNWIYFFAVFTCAMWVG